MSMITYLSTTEPAWLGSNPPHRCTACVDALLPDDAGDYVGRHRADMAAATLDAVLSWSPAAVMADDRIAACGTYLPGAPFHVGHEHDRVARYAAPAPVDPLVELLSPVLL